MRWLFLTLVVAVFLTSSSVKGGPALSKRDTTTETVAEEEERVCAWIDDLDDEINSMRNKGVIASWNYESNITDENQRISNDVSAEIAKEFKVSSWN